MDNTKHDEMVAEAKYLRDKIELKKALEELTVNTNKMAEKVRVDLLYIDNLLDHLRKEAEDVASR
jgi:hypothetical protein